jgi:two-component system, chemotaxis family, protein-glutamate methylesterase/glutaminase
MWFAGSCEPMSKNKRIKVLVVEDSHVVQMLLVHLLSTDPQIQVIGTAKNGRQALEFVEEHSPDVVLMDVQMPEMDGFEATRRIMESRPVPIIICSGIDNPHETITTFRLMEVGAVAFVEKPVGKEHRDYDAKVQHLLQTVKLMSEVKVVRRWPKNRRAGIGASAADASNRQEGKIGVVCIGASTGGPPVLQTILSGLPKEFSAPILIVQHIAPGFLQGLAEWLNQTTGVKVHIAAYGTKPLPGHVYLAPDDFHMTVRADGGIALSKDPLESGLRPSVARLFQSIAKTYGPRAIGVLLTGMGKDGAEELGLMKTCGALTIAQDRESSVVHGMPGEAISLGAATLILPADKIAAALTAQTNRGVL